MSENNSKIINKSWGGRFNTEQSAILRAINNSLDYDRQFYREDIQGSLAHCAMLVRQNIINIEDGRAIHDGLHRILHELDNGLFVFKDDDEDIHMAIEARLKEIIGAPAGRLHTARSRNDQTITDSKLWLRTQCQLAMERIITLQAVILQRARQYYRVIMPGFTHLQSAQPVSFGHHLMAYYEMFTRDYQRFADCVKHHDTCPLGAGALAGTSFAIDRHYTAQKLGFAAPSNNSMDSVASRDFHLEFLSMAQIHAIHLSRLAEEMVLWSSYQFQFIQLTDAFTTGSSIMPQKRNPDAAELVRAKVARINGALNGLAMVVKGLPLTYSKDLQEDKEGLFDAVKNLQLMQLAMAGMLGDFTANPTAMKRACQAGFITATDAADWLTQSLHIPFRETHHIVGKMVKRAEFLKLELSQLALAEWQAVDPRINQSIYDELKNRLQLANSVASRVSFGGTAPKNVLAQIKRAEKSLAKLTKKPI